MGIHYKTEKDFAIFLDFDGVLVTFRSTVGNYAMGTMDNPDHVALRFFDNLNRAFPRVGVVISSTWRQGKHAEYGVFDFRNMFAFAGCSGIRLFSDWRTKSLSGIRGTEIQEWLNRHPEVGGYLIVDDDSDMLPEQKDNFVHVKDGREGMMYRDFDRIWKTVEEYDKENPLDKSGGSQ